MVGRHVLDDGQSEAGAAGLPGPRLVGPVEALEDALLGVRGDADAPVGHRDLGVGVGAASAHRHGTARVRVGHGVVQQVGQCGDQQGVVTVDPEAAGPVGADPDVGGVGREPGPAQGLGDDGVDVHHGEFGQPLGTLQPGERDQLGDQPAQPGGLPQDLLAEPADLVAVVGGVHQRLGEHGDPTHRGLQFVADVGDEVPARGLQPDGLGVVDGLHHGVAVPERPELPEHRLRSPSPGLRRRQVDLGRLPGAQHLLGGTAGPRVGVMLPHQAEFLRAPVVQHRVAEAVEHQHPVVRGPHEPVEQVGRGGPRRPPAGPRQPAGEDEPGDEAEHRGGEGQGERS